MQVYECLFELFWRYSAWMYMVSITAYVWLKLPDCVADIFVVILTAYTEIFHKPNHFTQRTSRGKSYYTEVFIGFWTSLYIIHIITPT